MTRIYLVRHSETLFNILRRTQGQCDSPLTLNGIEMAKELGEYFNSVGIVFEHGYCSTSERTEDTLNYITNFNLPYTRLKKLKELAFGSLEGEDDDEIFKKFPDLNLETYDKYLGPYGLENTNLCAKRFDEALKEIAKTYSGNILVVSHGLVIVNWLARQSKEMIDTYYKRKKSPFIWMGNCDTLVFEVEDNEFKLVDYLIFEDFKKID